MSTDLYGIRVLSREGSDVRLRVFVACDDSPGLPNPALPGFFLMVLREAGVPVEGTIDDLMDPAFVHANAARWIADVAMEDAANAPSGLEYTFYYHRDGGWKDEERLPQAVYRVTLSDERWLDAVGRSWGTTAFEIAPFRGEEGLDRERLSQLANDAFNHGLNHRSMDEGELAELIRGLGHPDDRAVWPILEGLGSLGAPAKAAVPRICQLIDHGNADVVGNAAEALGRIGDPRAVGPLVALLSRATKGQPNAPIDAHHAPPDACVALAAIGPPAALALDAVRRVHAVSDGFLRAASALALHRIAAVPGALDEWLAAFEDEDADVSFSARLSIPALGPELPALAKRLEDALNDDMILVRVLPHLERLGPAAAPAIPALESVLAASNAHIARLRAEGLEPEEAAYNAEWLESILSTLRAAP